MDWLKLAQEAFESSTSYIDTNIRPDWDYSIRAFRSEHAPGSKYLSDDFKARSKIFPPYTRSVIRKNEAAGAVALFSNMDVVNVTPGNPDDVLSVASAAAIKEILEYRLSKTIPTFPLVMGAIQDAQTTGLVCSYQYWEYEQRNGRKIKDKPCIELRPIENIRFDSAANWIDVVNTSPYFCDIIPMYVCDVKGIMENEDEKTGSPKWKKFDDKIIAKARPEDIDTTRKIRNGDIQDPQLEESPIKDFDIVWVMRWFMKDSTGSDHVFYTLGTEELLTDPQPIEEVYFHGKRPYVIGYAIVETHKAWKSGVPTLTKPLQQESAEIRNQRLDNVKFVLNKRWIVARGRQVDVQSLVRNVPGGVTLATDPNSDIKESNWPDVTSSAYAEQDRLKSDFDDLAGNFSPSTRVANNAVNDTLGGSKLAAMGAGLMTDYLLRTIIETWWEPVLRQLVLLEQYYETDEIVLSVCANKAQLWPKFGISRITDMLLLGEVHVNVNVGMGSSDPQRRMQNFLAAVNAAIQVRGMAPPGVNVDEITKEIMSNAGYRDGARFFGGQQDPRLVKAMQTIRQLQGALQGKQMEIRAGLEETQLKIGSDERIKSAQIQVDAQRIAGDLRIRESEIEIERQRLNLEAIKLEIERNGATADLQAKYAKIQSDLEQAQFALQAERERHQAEMMKAGIGVQKSVIDLERATVEASREPSVSA